MTDRQFVKNKFPKSELEYRTGSGGGYTQNLINSYYRIWSDGLHKGVQLAKGKTSKEAWKRAKQFILDI